VLEDMPGAEGLCFEGEQSMKASHLLFIGGRAQTRKGKFLVTHEADRLHLTLRYRL
jgi:hypothetical protein